MIVLLALGLVSAGAAFAGEEISLFDSQGRAAAYIAIDDDLTFYLWSGRPVAYLVPERGSDFHVYGFNGRFLGWFSEGILYDRRGYAVCATRDALLSPPQLEPLKGLKQLKPLKGLRELPPLRPLFSRRWGETPCALHLQQGR